MTEDQTRETDVGMRFGDYIIGYFDVLGQSNRLLELPRNPEREDVMRHLRQTAGVILGIRECFEQYFTAEAELAVSLPSDERKLLEDTRLVPMGVCRHLHHRRRAGERRPGIRGDFRIYRTMCAASLMWLVSLSTRHPVRGGIEIGLAADIGPAEVYGPALVEAHRLESRVAEYPRIMVGPRCVRFLQNVVSDMPLTGAGKLARTCLRLLREISDEHAMLDGLGAEFLSRVQNVEQIRETFSACPPIRGRAAASSAS